MSTLFIVATPIGNLEDVSLRALRVLKEVDLILCEDTRVTKILLEHYHIKTSTISYHQHTKPEKMEYIFQLLQDGKNLALVSDAGTPGVSDPGNELAHFLLERDKSIKIIPIPGPSALITLASIAGFPTDRFVFLGYPPHKNKRKKFFEEVARSQYPVILYESPYRIIKTLQELAGIKKDMGVVVGREITKKFETIYRGAIDEVIEKAQKDKIKGEFVVIVEK